MSAVSEKPYIPIPSVGHELGIMFGFIGLFILAFAAYAIAYKIYNKKLQKKEAERVRALKASGWSNEKKEPRDAPLNGVDGTRT
ncbi:hypothetical protein BT63DRAFT_429136 [Microthyrium microscopicum]|uniref:Uncharacterized protein n=1 Tax=Microthyrium microscopicum TaxID=703497 RepID=A0A6A6U0T1_9PEZI|nr:hypothetical protein BT63DRAFT_429136 [Microthyrium microscopicum]